MVRQRCRILPSHSADASPAMGSPANFKIEMFVIRVGDWGGYMLVDCDDPIEVHKLCSMLPRSSSRRDLSFPSKTPCGANSRSWPGVTA